jgi:hypothetical protein
LATVINDVNGIIDAEGFLIVDGVKVKLEFFLGGDYKVNIEDAKIYVLKSMFT